MRRRHPRLRPGCSPRADSSPELSLALDACDAGAELRRPDAPHHRRAATEDGEVELHARDPSGGSTTADASSRLAVASLDAGEAMLLVEGARHFLRTLDVERRNCLLARALAERLEQCSPIPRHAGRARPRSEQSGRSLVPTIRSLVVAAAVRGALMVLSLPPDGVEAFLTRPYLAARPLPGPPRTAYRPGQHAARMKPSSTPLDDEWRDSSPAHCSPAIGQAFTSRSPRPRARSVANVDRRRPT